LGRRLLLALMLRLLAILLGRGGEDGAEEIHAGADRGSDLDLGEAAEAAVASGDRYIRYLPSARNFPLLSATCFNHRMTSGTLLQREDWQLGTRVGLVGGDYWLVMMGWVRWTFGLAR
jgi:hypothetical protein